MMIFICFTLKQKCAHLIKLNMIKVIAFMLIIGKIFVESHNIINMSQLYVKIEMLMSI